VVYLSERPETTLERGVTPEVLDDAPFLRSLVERLLIETMASNTTKNPVRRASDYVKGIGEPLDTLIGRDVILRSFEIDNSRPFKGETATIVLMEISELDSDDVATYHAWSQSLAIKLEELPKNELPLLIAFKKVRTSAGFMTLVFE
jgi:hypothetical protein